MVFVCARVCAREVIYGNVCQVVVQLLSQSNNTVHRAFHWVAGGNVFGDFVTSKIASLLQV